VSPIQRTWPEGLVVWLDFLRGVAALAVLALAAGLPVWRAIGHDARRLAREGAIALVVGWSLQVFFLVPWRLPLGPLWKFLAGRSFSVYAFHVPFILLGAMLAGGAVRFFGLDGQGWLAAAGVLVTCGLGILVCWCLTEFHSRELRRAMTSWLERRPPG